VGSLIAATLATVLLKLRNAEYRRMWEAEERDDDLDGIPDVYEEDDPAYHLRMAEIYDGKAAEHRRRAEEIVRGSDREEARENPRGQAGKESDTRHGLAEVTGGTGEEDDRPA
ncbi:hypothetical protein ABZT00_17025, partial [Streptomyces sp. NPDC005486]